MIAGAVAVACGTSAASATAQTTPPRPSKIVYVCGTNLCSVDPVSRTTTRITTDNAGYSMPAVSADGRRVAALRGRVIRAGRYGTNLPETWSGVIRGVNGLAMSPNGSQIAASYWYTELTNKLVYRWYCNGLCLDLVLEHRNGVQVYTRPKTMTVQRGSAGAGYLGPRLLSTDSDSGEWNSELREYVGGTESVCSIAAPAAKTTTCTPRAVLPSPPVPGGRDIQMSDPAGSPDGRRIAVVVGDVWEETGKIVDRPSGENPRIAVFDARTGARITVIPNGTRPSFSPDGRRIVFEGTDGRIRVAPSTGGAARVLVAGKQPVWASGPIVAAPTTTAPARVRANASAVTVRCARIESRPCTGRVALRSGTRTLAGGRFSLRPGQARSVRLPLTAVGTRVTAASRRVRVDVVTRSADGRVETGRRAAFLTR